MKHARTLCALAAVFAVLVGAPWAASATVYVDPTAPGPNDGTSWSRAFTTLQPAIDAAWAAGGDQVWVAGGPAGTPVVYGEARTEAWGSASVTGSLVMKDNVQMYGGFEGYRGGAGAQETALAQRALALSIALIDGTTARAGSPAYHVVVFGRSAAPTLNAVLDGFHITGGNASGEAGDYHTWRGGGIYNWGSVAWIQNCVVYGNQAAVSGGGVANVSGLVGPANARFVNCVIADNVAQRGVDTAGNPIRGGGGVFNDVADPVIVSTTVSGNLIGTPGYTLFGAYSGGVYNFESSPAIANCIVFGNSGGDIQDDATYGSAEVAAVSFTDATYAFQVWQPDFSWTVTSGVVPTGTGNISANPNFGGAYPFPYQITGAPCLDAGNPAPSTNTSDVRGVNRPLGAAIDMGAYEYSANGPVAACQAATVTLDAITGFGTLAAAAINGGSTAEAGIQTLVAGQTVFSCGDIGTPSVSLTVTDKLGRTASCNATVTVEDVTIPVITPCAADQSVPVDASCEGTIPNMTAGVFATHACGVASITQNPVAGSTFSGSALVTFTVTAATGTTNTCTATVTGLDSDPPVITTCAGDQTLAVNTSCQAAIPDLTGEIVYTDVCAVTVTQDPAAGTLVGLGNTVVTLRAEDASGNYDECTATITVEDTAAPVITSCAADQNLAADTSCQAAIPDLTGGVVYTDDCAVTVTQLPAAGTLVGLGGTVVTLRAEDVSGNFAECTATVTVTDAAPAAPVLLAVAPDSGASNSDFITTATDITLQGTVGSAVPGTLLNVRIGLAPGVYILPYNNVPTAGGLFAVPINGVTPDTYYMVFQTANNCGTLSAWSTEYTVVVDTTAPAITTCPADRDVAADTTCQGTIPDLTGDLVATDNEPGTLAVSQNPAAGTLAGLGATTVTMTVEDLAGNTSTCDVTVTVVDAPPAAPVLVQMVPDTGVAGDFITSATAFQLQGTVGSAVPGTLLNVRLHLATGLLPAVYAAQYENVPTAGGLFIVPLTGVAPGTYYMVFQTENNCGTLSAWTSEYIVVVDTAVPTITACAPDRQVAADVTCQGAIPDLTGDVVATDNTPGTLGVTQSPVAGTVVAMGDTTVTLTVTDLAGNTNTCDTIVTVADLTGPTFSVCAPDRALTPGPGCTGTVPDMLSEVTAGDTCGGTVVSIVQNPAAGASFTGAVTVVFTATDDSGNTGTCETLVSLTDTVDPVAVCQNFTVDPADGTVTGADIDGGSTDNCVVFERLIDGAASVTYTCADLGDHTVTLTVLDANGNSDTCTATVSVVDATAPEITLIGNATVVLDNGDTYTELGATALDGCDGDLTGILVTGGDTVNDRVIGEYTVTYAVDDAAGNSAVANRHVVVRRETCALVVEAVATDVDASPGDTVVLEVTLGAGNCAVGDIHYDWKKDDGSKALVSLPGADDSPVLTLTDVTVADSGVYVCEVSDDMYAVQSPEITLSVASGVPAAGGLGLALAALAAALTGVGALRRRK